MAIIGAISILLALLAWAYISIRKSIEKEAYRAKRNEEQRKTEEYFKQEKLRAVEKRIALAKMKEDIIRQNTAYPVFRSTDRDIPAPTIKRQEEKKKSYEEDGRGFTSLFDYSGASGYVNHSSSSSSSSSSDDDSHFSGYGGGSFGGGGSSSSWGSSSSSDSSSSWDSSDSSSDSSSDCGGSDD